MLPETLTPEWVAKEFKEDGYESKCSLSTTKGAKQLMKDYLKTKGMYHSETDNAEKWRRVVRDAVHEEHHLAVPYHYSSTPAKFYMRWDFIAYHYCVPKRLLHSPLALYTLAFVFTYYAHYWSFELYTRPFGPLPKCSKFPLQPQCHFLKNVQDYTFNSWYDVARVVSLWMVQNVFKQLAQVIAPLRRH